MRRFTDKKADRLEFELFRGQRNSSSAVLSALTLPIVFSVQSVRLEERIGSVPPTASTTMAPRQGDVVAYLSRPPELPCAF